MQDDVCSIDDLHADGAVAGFLFYPVDSFADEDADVSTQKIFDFRDELENYIGQKAADAVTVTGGAIGTQFCYLDFIAWDLRAVLSAAKEFFENSDLPFAGFHVFRQGLDYVTLIGSDKEKEESIEELEYIPYTPENAEAFYQQLEQWNDADEFTRCITTLETLPEDLRDYRAAYAQRWAELDPNDDCAQMVIQECREEIEKRNAQTNPKFVTLNLNARLDGMYSLLSWWEGSEHTALYYYGVSYGQMLAAITDFIGEHPLCQKCIVKQIAGEQKANVGE